ncbi:MAG: archease [Gemmatales bacterium]|nr:archease [Gemmatales bacterium]
MYEVFEHTADLGLRIRAKDLATLFQEAGRALFSVIVENLDAVSKQEARCLELENQHLEYLFFDWLNQLLYLFDAHHLILSDFQVCITMPRRRASDQEAEPLVRTPTVGARSVEDQVCWHLLAEVRGEKLDRQRHLLDHEVKAITYHGLKVEETAEGWLAEVIVDI